MKPSIGRAVHYVPLGAPACRAATVTEVYDNALDSVSLCVMNLTGLDFPKAVPRDEDLAAGTWHWPERT